MTLRGSENSEAISKLLEERFEATPNALGGPPVVSVGRHTEVAATLRDEFNYRIFGFVVAAHYPPGPKDPPETPGMIRVSYGLRTIGKGTNVAAWQVCVNVGDAIPSLVQLFSGADWQEREQYDLVGVRFEGHPDLRRLMLSEDWSGHPLRKDYAIDTKVHPWR